MYTICTINSADLQNVVCTDLSHDLVDFFSGIANT